MRKAFFQLHIAIFLAGFTGILGKLITLNAGLLVWYRLLITCATLWLITLFLKKVPKVSRHDMIQIFMVGAIAALHWVTFYASVKYANVSVALVCFSAIGFFTALLEPVILKTKHSRYEVLLGLMTIAGIYIIFHFDPQYKTGIILGIISAILASLFPIYNKRFLRLYVPETVTMYELTGGFVFLTILLPFFLIFLPADHIVPTLSDFGWLLMLSWLCTVVAFNLSMRALKKVSAFTVNLSYNLEPVYGILLAFIIYQENELLGTGFYVGLLLIVMSVVMQTWLMYRERRRVKEQG
jgi:drug/metabolite transporter (DMT)-like permease